MRGQRNFFSILAQPYNSHREGRRVLTPQSGGYPETMGYVYGRHPDANLAASMAPPPYTEVIGDVCFTKITILFHESTPETDYSCHGWCSYE
jgi:hypothetical protein